MNVIHRTFDAAPESGDEMIVGGFITTANEDRHGDIVDPKGVDTTQLQVLLESHDHTNPVGRLIDTEERAGGIYARFKVISEDAWAKVKSGLLPAFSIGFIPRSSEAREAGGWLYKAVEIIETSLVSIPSNRESQILEVRSAQEANTMNEEKSIVNFDNLTPDNAYNGKPKIVSPPPNFNYRNGEGKIVSPAHNVHTKVHEYSLQKAMKSILDHRVPVGLEGEADQELRAAQPWRDFGGCAVPITEIFLTQKQKREIEKASGVYIPTNLAVLTGTEHRDELMALIDDAIGNQTLMGLAGVRTITGLTEDTVRVPRQTAMMSAAHTLIDTDLPDSADPAFSNADLKPRFVGSIAELSMSAILAQHPRIGTDFIGMELRRALTQELERAFLNGNNSTDPAEPNGLVVLADNSNALTAATLTAQADIIAAVQAYEEYSQETNDTLTWIMGNQFVDSLQAVTAFDGTGLTTAAWWSMYGAGQDIIKGLNMPTTGSTTTGFFGDFSYFVHGIWEAADVSLNPYADSVFKKKATLLRVSMLHDFQAIDTRRMLQIETTP